MAEAVRLALIGCGRIAQVAHCLHWRRPRASSWCPCATFSAAVARSVAGRYGVPAAHTDPVRSGPMTAVEAVLITAPDRFHHSLSTQALEAGKHALVEKPLASTGHEAEDLVGLVDRTGLVLQVGAMKRHDQGLQYARAFVAERLGGARYFNAWYRIGDLRSGIEATLFPPVFAETEARRHETRLKADRQRYLLVTHGAHIFDTVRFLLGDVASVVARHRRGRTRPRVAGW